MQQKDFPKKKLLRFVRKINTSIILLGGKEDVEVAEFVQSSVGDKVYNACGKYSLNQSASLVKQAAWIITHDTGLMHIAAAFKKKIISVWGNTIPEFGMNPYFPDEASQIMEVKGLKCRPCTKIGFSRCPKKHFKCMNDIDEDKIAGLLNNVD